MALYQLDVARDQAAAQAAAERLLKDYPASDSAPMALRPGRAADGGEKPRRRRRRDRARQLRAGAAAVPELARGRGGPLLRRRHTASRSPNRRGAEQLSPRVCRVSRLALGGPRRPRRRQQPGRRRQGGPGLRTPPAHPPALSRFVRGRRGAELQHHPVPPLHPQANAVCVQRAFRRRRQGPVPRRRRRPGRRRRPRSARPQAGRVYLRRDWGDRQDRSGGGALVVLHRRTRPHCRRPRGRAGPRKGDADGDHGAGDRQGTAAGRGDSRGR